MSLHEEDLIDYSDEELPTNEAAGATGNGEQKKATTGGPVASKGSYASVHISRFEDLFLKPELVRAITDCGFEHPSEG
jgi:ATP-dependent RNA helicase UAP56/SUB2